MELIIYFEDESAIMGLDYKKLGVNVKHYRKECGLTQKQVADIIHITEQHISHIETGRTKASLEVIVDIANALHTDVSTLLEESLPEARDSVLMRKLLDTVSNMEQDEFELLIDISTSIKEYSELKQKRRTGR